MNESLPFIDLNINWALKDLLHPGLPIINNGIFVFKHTKIENKFSNKALFFAIPLSKSTAVAIISWIFLGKVSKLKSLPKEFFIKFINSFLNNLLNILI